MLTTVDDSDARWDNAGKREMLLELTQGHFGFHAGKRKHNRLRPVLGGIFAGSTSNPRVIEAAQSAISYLNRREGKNLQVVELVRVNYLPCSGKVNYLTIKASDNDFYEAEVCANIRLEHEVYFVRSAVHYPNVSPEILEYNAPDASD